MRATLIRRIRSHGVGEATGSCRATTTDFPRCLAQQNWKSKFISSLSLRPWQFSHSQYQSPNLKLNLRDELISTELSPSGCWWMPVGVKLSHFAKAPPHLTEPCHCE
jgi:hypothetical protein